MTAADASRPLCWVVGGLFAVSLFAVIVPQLIHTLRVSVVAPAKKWYLGLACVLFVDRALLMVTLQDKWLSPLGSAVLYFAGSTVFYSMFLALLMEWTMLLNVAVHRRSRAVLLEEYRRIFVFLIVSNVGLHVIEWTVLALMSVSETSTTGWDLQLVLHALVSLLVVVFFATWSVRVHRDLVRNWTQDRDRKDLHRARLLLGTTIYCLVVFVSRAAVDLYTVITRQSIVSSGNLGLSMSIFLVLCELVPVLLSLLGMYVCQKVDEGGEQLFLQRSEAIPILNGHVASDHTGSPLVGKGPMHSHLGNQQQHSHWSDVSASTGSTSTHTTDVDSTASSSNSNSGTVSPLSVDLELGRDRGFSAGSSAGVLVGKEEEEEAAEGRADRAPEGIPARIPSGLLDIHALSMDASTNGEYMAVRVEPSWDGAGSTASSPTSSLHSSDLGERPSRSRSRREARERSRVGGSQSPLRGRALSSSLPNQPSGMAMMAAALSPQQQQQHQAGLEGDLAQLELRERLESRLLGRRSERRRGSVSESGSAPSGSDEAVEAMMAGHMDMETEGQEPKEGDDG